MAFLPRLSLRCLLEGHEPLMRQKRDEVGRAVKPHVLIWECCNCHSALGETSLGAKWNLLAKLRRQRTPAQISANATDAMTGVSADRTASAVPVHARR